MNLFEIKFQKKRLFQADVERVFSEIPKSVI